MNASRIIHVTAYYPPHLGGQEIAVQDLVAQLALAGEQAEVVTSSIGAGTGVSVENDVPVTRLKSSELAHTAIIWSLFFWLLRHARRDTIVHLHAGQLFTPEAVWLAAKVKRFRYIFHLHSDLVQSGPMGKFLPLHKKLFLGREINDAELVIVLNNELRRAVRRDHGYDGKLLIMSNGIDEGFFRTARKPGVPETFKLLFVGRLSPHKNLTALLEALSMIRREITLDIVGDGECSREVRMLIADSKLGNVRLHGRQSRDEVKRFYATCSALILPSLYEAQPIALLEAMASRIPVIVTKGIGIELSAQEAVLIEPTAQGIADGIESLAAMAPEEQELLAEAAFKRAEQHRWHALIDSYTDLYDEIAEDIALRWSGRNAGGAGQRHGTDTDAS
jgi:glycosyltransferase involved in cell wall biosynthesis